MKLIAVLVFLLGCSCLAIGSQFLRGKWLKLMSGNNFHGDLPTGVAAKAAKTSGIATLVCGIYLFFVAYYFWQLFTAKVLLTVTGIVLLAALIFLINRLLAWVKTGY